MRTLMTFAIAAWVSIAAPAPTIPFTEATVTSTDGATYTIAWVAPAGTEVMVYAGTQPTSIGRDHLVGRGGATGQVVAQSLPPAARWYFELVPSRGHSLVIADRSLHLATAPNFRDAGGYRTADGRWVRMGLVYRSDQLDKLGNADLETLTRDHIRLVCDLRTDAERASGMDRVPANATALIADVVGSDRAALDRVHDAMSDSAKEREVLGNHGAERFMIETYRRFVNTASAQHAYHAIFTRLADSTALPGVFHCSSGKDRTGWATAVFLTTLGVPRQTIINDYLLSNTYLRAKHEAELSRVKPGIDKALLEPISSVDASYLAAAFDEVQRRYGSFDRYLHKGLALDDATIAALRAEFLTG
jgi:protein-tyrosine phosphatase